MQPRILGILECAAANAAQTKLRATKGAQLRLKTYVRRNCLRAERKVEILEYKEEVAKLKEYQPQFPVIAEYLIEELQKALPGIEAEHVGSTSVPDCPGKGVLDIMVLFQSTAERERIKETLRTLGFQNQTTRDPFPEDRPMRVGSFFFEEQSYPVHIHVISAFSGEVEELRSFREALKSSIQLRSEYAELKKEIIEKGITDTVDYAESKSAFIEKQLAAIRPSGNSA